MKIGLALSGGGAMGAAHLGAMDAIRKNNIKIDSVCGTSAGAIAGILFATGQPDAIEKFLNDFKELGFNNKTNLIFKKNVTIFGKIEETLRKNVKAKSFSELKINFSCVATDIITGKKVLLSRGDPVTAVMASAAYPGIFPIQKLNGKLLVDGCLTSNFPVGILREEKMDFVIGSSLFALNKIDKEHSSGKRKLNQIEVAIRSVDIMSNVLAEREAKDCDFCFYPPVEGFAWYDFDRFSEIAEVGRKYGKANSEKLLEKIEIASKKISK